MTRFFSSTESPEQEIRKVAAEMEATLSKACGLKNSDENRACYQSAAEFNKVAKAPQAHATQAQLEEGIRPGF